MDMKLNFQLLYSILEALPVGVFIKTLSDDFKITYWSQGAEKIFLIPREKVLNKSAYELWPKDQADLYLAADKKVLEEKKPVDIPCEPSMRGDGSKIWLHTVKVPFQSTPGGPYDLLLCVSVDITEQRNAAKQLQNQESLLNRILDALPVLVGHFDKNFINLHANRRYFDYFGKSAEEIKGRHAQDIIGPELFKQNLSYMQSALLGKKTDMERQLTQMNGETKDVFIQYLPVDDQGEITGYVVTVQDVSPFKRLEQERLHMEQALNHAAQLTALGEMAGGIAHEINNPLAIIKGKVFQLKRAVKNPETKVDQVLDDLQHIDATVDRIAQIIKGLRTMSRHSEFDPMQVCALRQIIDDALVLCQEKFAHNNIPITLGLQEPALRIRCRGYQISQILINLINNSFDAIAHLSDKWLRIEAFVRDQYFVIAITDSGSGIPEATRKKMMQPFFTTKDVGKGTGLGLSISRKICQDHQGDLVYDQTSPHTCFRIELPLSSIIYSERQPS